MKTGLVLSGGGVMGAAHAGAIKAIIDNNIKIDAVCGTSAGAIAGLLFASGRKNAYENFLNDFRSLGFTNKTTLILKRNDVIFSQFEKILRKNVGVKRFSDLEIDFSCVATNIVNGEMVLLKQGDPVTAVMASSAYPGAFPIQEINGKYFVDGGLTNNFPVSVLKNKGMDFIIGSFLYNLENIDKKFSAKKHKMNPVEIAIRSVDIMSSVIAKKEAEDCDFCFTPPVEKYSWYEFDQFDKIINVGKKYGAANAKKMIRKIELAKQKIS